MSAAASETAVETTASGSCYDEATAGTIDTVPPLTEEQILQQTERITSLDGDDLAHGVVDELVEWSLREVEELYVERRLIQYTARDLTSQLFALILACEPSYEPSASVLQQIEMPTYRATEDPPRCQIDAFCRNEIDTRDPPVPRLSSSESSPVTRPSTPQKTKRLTVTTSLAASALLSGAASPSSRSAAAFRSAAAKTGATGSTTPHKPVPGVPYSIGPAEDRTVSPRKSIALLKMAVRLAATSPPHVVDESADDSEDLAATGGEIDEELRPLDDSKPRKARSPRKRSVDVSSTSTAAWSLILPSNRSLLMADDEQVPADVGTSVSVEYVLPRLGSSEPGIRRRSSVMVAKAASLHESTVSPREGGNSPRKPSVFLPRADEQDTLEVDPLGMLGYELRSQLSLSAGVRMQSEDGNSVLAGPELPVVATKMRRSTFMDESLLAIDFAAAANDRTPSFSPTRPVTVPPSHTHTRPSTCFENGYRGDSQSQGSEYGTRPFSPHSNNGVFSLTECAANGTTCGSGGASGGGLARATSLSTRSLAVSNASSTSATTTTSLKNLFRKPSKVARPCTASSQCCGGNEKDRGNGTCASNEAFADLVKQRAFQRKPSLVNAISSPPKRTQSRRSVLTQSNSIKNASTNHLSGNTGGFSPSSPLSRRSLLAKTPSSNNCHGNDPLCHVTSIL